MILIYDKPNFHSFPMPVSTGADGKVNYRTLTLSPGKNEISKEDWALMLKEYKKPIESMLYDSGELKIFEDDEVRKKMSAMTQKQAKELVENTMSIEDLEEYIVEENRKANPRDLILKMINKQIDLLSSRFNNENKNGDK